MLLRHLCKTNASTNSIDLRPLLWAKCTELERIGAKTGPLGLPACFVFDRKTWDEHHKREVCLEEKEATIYRIQNVKSDNVRFSCQVRQREVQYVISKTKE